MELSEKEKKVIRILETGINTYIEKIKVTKIELKTKEAETILNLIQKLQKENEKQSKVIDETTSILLKTYRDWEVFRFEFQNHICEKMMNPESEENDCYLDIYDDNACNECIKQYFYRKVEEDDKGN